jgi:hypothetical protein
MRSFLAALRTLVLPYGKTSGQRIVLDGVNGEIDVYDDTNQKAVAIGPGPEVLVTGDGVIDILDPTTNKEAVLMVRGGAGTTPEIMLNGSGTFASGSISMTLQMDDLNDQKFRMFMGRRGQDDSRAAINQWDIEATRNYFAMNGYDVDFATSTHGWMFDPTPPGALVALVAGVKETWHDVALLNGWANRAGFDHLSYRIDVTGRVFFRGSIAGGTSVSGTQIGTVPAGYRPASNETMAPIASDNLPAAYAPASARCRILTTGEIYIYTTGAGPLYFNGYNYSTY